MKYMITVKVYKPVGLNFLEKIKMILPFIFAISFCAVHAGYS